MNKNSGRPVVNLEALLNTMGGDQEVFEQFIKKIPKHAATSFQSLVNAVDNKNAEEIEFAAHSLRGICLYLEMYKITDLTLQIEKLAGQNKLNEITPYLISLEDELGEALDYIKNHEGSMLEVA